VFFPIYKHPLQKGVVMVYYSKKLRIKAIFLPLFFFLLSSALFFFSLHYFALQKEWCRQAHLNADLFNNICLITAALFPLIFGYCIIEPATKKIVITDKVVGAKWLGLRGKRIDKVDISKIKGVRFPKEDEIHLKIKGKKKPIKLNYIKNTGAFEKALRMASGNKRS
jgi:hypothetical protein